MPDVHDTPEAQALHVQPPMVEEEFACTKPSWQVQLVVGSHEELDGQIHWVVELEPTAEYVEFGHCAG